MAKQPHQSDGSTPAAGGLPFSRRQRLSHAREFQAAFAARCSVPAGPLRVHARLNASDPPTARLGLSVGRRVGSAVRRTRVKRLVREAFRLEQRALPAGLDLVVVVHPHAELPLAEYRRLLVSAAATLARRAGRGGAP